MDGFDPTRDTLTEKKVLAKLLRKQLINGVPVIQSFYGIEESRYIIPPLFRYEYKAEKKLRGK